MMRILGCPATRSLHNLPNWRTGHYQRGRVLICMVTSQVSAFACLCLDLLVRTTCGLRVVQHAHVNVVWLLCQAVLRHLPCIYCCSALAAALCCDLLCKCKGVFSMGRLLRSHHNPATMMGQGRWRHAQKRPPQVSALVLPCNRRRGRRVRSYLWLQPRQQRTTSSSSCW